MVSVSSSRLHLSGSSVLPGGSVRMPGADKETDLSERIEAFLAELKRSGSSSGSVRGSAETARDTAALLRRITAQARWSSAGLFHIVSQSGYI